MKYFYLLLISLLIVNFTKAQNPIIDYQKINELEGGLMHQLDLDDRFGKSVDSIGDLNLDGVTDIVVGAHLDDDGGTDKGAVYILFLNANGTVNHEQKISDTEGNFSGVLDDGDAFGFSVSSLGDLNNDGCGDLAVGAEYDCDAGFWHGAFYILFLDTNGTVQSYNKINETDLGVTISGTPVFGTDIENIGDLNGDGVIDLAVGSRRDDDGGTFRGAVWILFMNSDGTVQGTQKISDTQGGLTHSLDNKDYFGRSIANMGDIDGDGNTDIAVGAHGDDDGGTDKGAIYILFLNSNGTIRSEQKISATEGNFTATTNSNQYFGISLTSIGDINWDNKMDVIVGAPGDATNGAQSGAFFILHLDNNGTVISHQFVTEGYNYFTGNLEADNFFGHSVASIGVLGTTHRLLIGASRDSASGVQKGAVWILSIKGRVNTGIDTDIITQDNFNLYPNPSTGRFNIEAEGIQSYKVFDISGKEIYASESLSLSKCEIDLSTQPKGIYIVKVITDKQAITQRVIKQ